MVFDWLSSPHVKKGASPFAVNTWISVSLSISYHTSHSRNSISYLFVVHNGKSRHVRPQFVTKEVKCFIIIQMSGNLVLLFLCSSLKLQFWHYDLDLISVMPTRGPISKNLSRTAVICVEIWEKWGHFKYLGGNLAQELTIAFWMRQFCGHNWMEMLSLFWHFEICKV